jgi:hypothetical protein
MQGIIYEESSIWLFLLVTVIMGGWAAWMTGKAVASNWRPPATLAVYLLLLGAAVRFIHFALFHGTLISPRYYFFDTLVLFVIGFLGWRHTRAGQMTTQYRWLYERSGPLGWKRRTSAEQ